MIDEASELRIAIGRVLERWQTELLDSPEQQSERCALLAEHIAEVKRAIAAAAELGELASSEAAHVARLVADPPDGDRIGPLLRWIELKRIEARREKESRL